MTTVVLAPPPPSAATATASATSVVASAASSSNNTLPLAAASSSDAAKNINNNNNNGHDDNKHAVPHEPEAEEKENEERRSNNDDTESEALATADTAVKPSATGKAVTAIEMRYKKRPRVSFESADIVEFEPTLYTTTVTSGGIPVGMSFTERSRSRRRLDSWELERTQVRVGRQNYMEEGYLDPTERESILNKTGYDDSTMVVVEAEVNRIIADRRESNEVDFEFMYGLGEVDDSLVEEEEEEEDEDEDGGDGSGSGSGNQQQTNGNDESDDDEDGNDNGADEASGRGAAGGESSNSGFSSEEVSRA